MSQFPLHDQASPDLPGGRHRRRQHVRGDPGGRGPSPPQAAAGREEMNGRALVASWPRPQARQAGPFRSVVGRALLAPLRPPPSVPPSLHPKFNYSSIGVVLGSRSNGIFPLSQSQRRQAEAGRWQS